MENKISQEVAVEEIKALVFEHNADTITNEKALESYKNSIKAIERGSLVIDGDNVTYKLHRPFGSGDSLKEEIKFKTRIKPQDNENISKGIDLKNETFKYINRCNMHLSGLAIGQYNELSKVDLKVIEEVCSIFL